MSELMSEHKSFVIGMCALGIFLVIGSFAASAYGAGIDKPKPEEQRGQSVRSGGHFFIFYSGGGYGQGARGIGGRSAMGGGPGMGK